MRRLSCLVLAAAAAVVFASPVFGQGLTQLAEVMGAQPGYYFGASVAMSGDTMVVGVPGATAGCGQPTCGAAYVFTAANGDWGSLTQVATLTPSNGITDGGFGGAVAISGSTIVVSGSGPTGAGAIYVFVEPAGGWINMTETAELTVSTSVGNLFSVAIDGETVVVGAEEASSNKAYVYVEPASGWVNMTQTAELVSSLSTGHIPFLGRRLQSAEEMLLWAPPKPPSGE